MQLKAETAVGLFVLAALGVLIYMSFQIGSLRFATHHYIKYSIYSRDISGLNKKADVRIAGVKVGWIDQVIFQEDQQRVLMAIMILKKYHLYKDASSIIRQNGILGGKYLEIIPGDPLLEKLEPNSHLHEFTQDSVSIDDVMKKIDTIAGSIADVTESLKNSLGGDEGTQRINDLVHGCISVTDKVSLCADALERIISFNEDDIHDAIENVNGCLSEVKEAIPLFQEKIDKISQTFERDFDRVTRQIELLMPSLTDVLESYKKNKGFVIKHTFRLF